MQNEELITFPSEKVPFSPMPSGAPRLLNEATPLVYERRSLHEIAKKRKFFRFSLIEQFWQSDSRGS
jgi:hypothetical protein